MCYWDSVIQNAIGCTLGSLAAIWVSFFIYKESTKESRKQKEREENRNRKEAYKLFSLLVHNVCNATATLIKNVGRFTDDLLKSSEGFPLLTYTPLNDFKRLSELQELQKFLISFTHLWPEPDTAVTSFADILAKTDYLGAQFNALTQQIERGAKFHHERQIQVKDLIEKCNDNLKNTLGPLPQNDPLRAAFRAIIDPYMQGQKGKTVSLSFHVAQFLKPTYDLLVSIQLQGGLDNRLQELKFMAGKAIGIYNQMPQHNKVLSDSIKETLGDINIVANELSAIADKLK